jgi:hypothetical protein
MPYTTKIGHVPYDERGLDRSLAFYLQSHYPGANLFS